MIPETEKHDRLTEKARRRLYLFSLIIFAAFSVLAAVYIGRPLIKFVSRPEDFRLWAEEKGIFGRMIFVGMFVLQILVALIPGEPLEIAAGYTFGAIEGTLLVMLGVVLGSALVFLFVRKFGIKLVEVFFPREKINSLKYLRDAKRRNILIFAVFFIPGTPKDLLTYFIGLTDIKFTTMLLITTFARIPSIVTSTIGGDALGLKKYVFAVIVFSATLIISAAGLYIFNRMSKINRKE